MFRLITKQEFKAGRREPMLDYGRYQASAKDATLRIQRMDANLNDPVFLNSIAPGRVVQTARFRAELAIDQMALHYSAGTSIVELRDRYAQALAYCEAVTEKSIAWASSPDWPGSQVPSLSRGGDGYNRANQMVCFGILLGCENLLPRLAVVLDFRNLKMDAVLERLLAPYVHGRTATPDACTRVLPYWNILKLFAVSEAERPQLLSDYLGNWYRDSRDELIFESHKCGEGFTGYWSWEAAAIAFTLGIDDTLFASLSYYPKDLAYFRRCHD